MDGGPLLNYANNNTTQAQILTQIFCAKGRDKFIKKKKKNRI